MAERGGLRRTDRAVTTCRLPLNCGTWNAFTHCHVPIKRGTPFHRKTIHQGKYYGPQPIAAGPGLTLLKTKVRGQAPEPPSAPSLRPSSLRLTLPPWHHPGARSLWRHRGARPLCTATASLNPLHFNTLPRVSTGPYLFLLRNRSLSHHAGSPRNL
jgi:hypothetical protein